MEGIELTRNVLRFLGAGASISDGDYTSILTSITSVEARHAAYLRASLGESAFISPFDTPLDLVSWRHINLSSVPH